MRTSGVLECPLCDQRLFRELVSRAHPYQQRFCRCAGCGLVRMVSEKPFQSDYWEDEAVTLNVYSNDRVRAEMRARYARYLPVIARLCGGAGTLLDAGCGIGNFLLAAREAGWRVAGLEASEKAARIARSRGLEIETSRLEESRLAPEAFDVVTLWDVLAHFEDPVGAMQVVHKTLRPGGAVFLETPNEGFWVRSAVRKLFSVSRGRIDLLGYFYYPDHRFYFTTATIRQILERAGFRNVEVWQEVTSPAKARLKIAPGRFPLRRFVLPLLPLVLDLLRGLGLGNKLMVTAKKV